MDVVPDLVALSAIATRLLDGLTPNRLAVLGANVLVLAHLALLLYRYARLIAGSCRICAAAGGTVTARSTRRTTREREGGMARGVA